MSSFLFAALRRVLVPLLLVGCLCLPYVGGDPLAYPVILVVVLIILVHLALPQRWSIDPATPLFLGSFVLIAIAFVLTSRPGTNDFMLTFNFIMFVLFVPLAAGLLRTARPGNAAMLANLALAGAVLSLLFALYQVYALHDGRAAGFGSNAIRSAMAALFLGFFAPIGFMQVSGPRRWLYLLGPLCAIAVVYLSGSRGPFLAVPPLLAVALLVIPKNRWLGFGVLAVLVVGATALLLLEPQLFGRLGTLPKLIDQVMVGNVDEKSGNIRYRIWTGSIAAFLQSPWIGYGWVGKTAAVDAHLLHKVFHNSPRYHLHSDILDFGVSAGIAGLVAYVMVLAAPLVSVLQSPRDSQFQARLYGVLVLLVGYVCCGAVNLMFGFELMTTLYVAFAAILLTWCRDDAVGGPLQSRVAA